MEKGEGMEGDGRGGEQACVEKKAAITEKQKLV